MQLLNYFSCILSFSPVMHQGWPSLQACILKDFVFLARRRQANMDSIRYTCYLLKMLYRHLSGLDLMEITEMLDDIVTEAHVAQEDNKAVILDCLNSPVSLSEFPCVRFFTPNSLDDVLAPHHRAGFMSPGSDSNSQVNNSSSNNNNNHKTTTTTTTTTNNFCCSYGYLVIFYHCRAHSFTQHSQHERRRSVQRYTG